ncbi:MAG: hypothetical protein A3F41_06115 [Coxiella sp. RIFCSPHIGHO2_12_FULL_44_14]|nr:MAG: hypothetical protein A3F41_06115 [Coxiella sp. RIFCSPHIGHO2_12_FULL_44_14]
MKLLVVGCGSIGKRHAENAARYAEVGIYDQNRSAVLDIAEKIRSPVFPTWEAALAWRPDGVIISTPHHTHVTFAQEAVMSGAHVLVEKPISHTLASVPSLIQCARQQDRKLFVVCNLRFHRAITVLREHLLCIGKPLFARAHYGHYLPYMRPQSDYRSLYAAQRAMGGGVILDAIHEVDYLRWFFGEVEAVFAEAGRLSTLDVDVEDYASLVLRHSNGVRSEIHLDYLQQCKRRGCEIIGEEGTLHWQSTGKQPEICTVTLFLKSQPEWKTLYHSLNEDANQSYDQLMYHFVHALAGQATELASAEDGLATLAVSLAAVASAEQGKSVRI